MGKLETREMWEIGAHQKCWVTYEDGKKVYETVFRKEGLNPEGVYITRDYNTGREISRTRHMPEFINPAGVAITRDTSGKVVSETRHMSDPLNPRGMDITIDTKTGNRSDSLHMTEAVNPLGVYKTDGNSSFATGIPYHRNNLEKRVEDKKTNPKYHAPSTAGENEEISSRRKASLGGMLQEGGEMFRSGTKVYYDRVDAHGRHTTVCEDHSSQSEKSENHSLQRERNELSKRYAGIGALLLAIIGGLSGCWHWVCVFGSGGKFMQPFNLFTGAIIGAIAGAIIGGIWGQLAK